MKLRPRIAIVSCLVALTSVGVTGALLVRRTRAWSADELLQRQTLIAQSRALAISDHLDTAARELIRLSRSAEVDLTDNDVRPEAALLAHAHRNSTLFDVALQVVDAGGRCLWSEPSTAGCPGRSFAQAPWFVEGRHAKGAVFVPERAVDGTEVNVVVPVGGRFDAPDGVLRGVIRLGEGLVAGAALHGAYAPASEAAVVAGSGEVLYPDQLPSGTGWQRALAEAPSGPAAAFVAGGFLYAFAPIAHTGWGLVYRWPQERLDSALQHQLTLLLAILGFGGALAVLLGSVSSTYVTQPIIELANAVRVFAATRGRGDARFEAPRAAQRSDEIGELARAFAELRSEVVAGDRLHQADLERIRELASSLEERVRARTAELEAAQRSLTAQERLAAMGRAAAVISHELKNSLNALGMGFDFVAQEAARSPQLQRVHAQVRAEVNRLRTMSDELLVFARTPRLEAEPVDLNELVRSTVALCVEQAGSSGVRIEARLEALAPVACDRNRIQSVLVNLLQNAVEAVAWAKPAPARREVVISTSNGGNFARIGVEDSGPGVPHEVLEHLFEPFFTTKRNGTGLGLATAQRFAAAHGGHIELQRSALGGARFELKLPLSPAQGEA